MRRVVTVVSKRGCHLCDDVIGVLESLSSRHDFEVRVLDIADDRALHDRYWLTIPVVQVDGKDIFDARDFGARAGLARRLEASLKA